MSIMAFMKNRLTKSLIGVCLSLALFVSGSMVVGTQSAQAAAVTTSKANTIVWTAEYYIGRVTYRFGVRDPQHLRFDCSSFTQFIYKQVGINIPWGSSAQARLGTPVDKWHLSKGDLVMFSVSTPGRINHVGIYIGNGKFISNTTSSGVVISSLNSGYWKNRFITGRHL
jgi:murein DD-endopeptidase / murein LD-carboxypeptidase